MKKGFILCLCALLCLLNACGGFQQDDPVTTFATTSILATSKPLWDEPIWIDLSSKEHRTKAQEGLDYLSQEYGISQNGCEVFLGMVDYNNDGIDDWILYCRGAAWKGIYHDGMLFVIFRSINGIVGQQPIVCRKFFYSDEKPSEITLSIANREIYSLDPLLVSEVQYLELQPVTDSTQYAQILSLLGVEGDPLAETTIYTVECDLNCDGTNDYIYYVTGVLWGGSGGGGSLYVKLAKRLNTIISVATTELLSKEEKLFLPIIPSENTYASFILGNDNVWSWNEAEGRWG